MFCSKYVPGQASFPLTVAFFAKPGIRICRQVSAGLSELSSITALSRNGYLETICTWTVPLGVSTCAQQGTRLCTTGPRSFFITAEIANFDHAWLKFAVQQPKWGSSPNMFASLLLELYGFSASGIRAAEIWFVIWRYWCAHISGVVVAGMELNASRSSKSPQKGFPPMESRVSQEYIISATLQHSLPWIGASPDRHSSPVKCPVAILLYFITFWYMERANSSGSSSVRQDISARHLNAMAVFTTWFVCVQYFFEAGFWKSK